MLSPPLGKIHQFAIHHLKLKKKKNFYLNNSILELVSFLDVLKICHKSSGSEQTLRFFLGGRGAGSLMKTVSTNTLRQECCILFPFLSLPHVPSGHAATTCQEFLLNLFTRRRSCLSECTRLCERLLLCSL